MPRFPTPTDDANGENQQLQLEQLLNLVDAVGAANINSNPLTLTGQLLDLRLALGEPVLSPDIYTLLGRIVELIAIEKTIRDRLPSALANNRITVDAIARHAVATGATRSLPNVTTTTAIAIPANTNRKGLIAFNRGTNVVYMSFVNQCSALAHRHAIAANGVASLYTVNEPYTGSWYAAVASGTSGLEVFELV